MKKHDGYVLVNVRAQEREYFSGFNREGVHWPSAIGGKMALVSPQVLTKLKAERMLFVDTSPEFDGDLSLVEKVDSPARYYGNETARVEEQAEAIEQRLERKKRALNVEALLKEEAAVDAQLAALESQKTAASLKESAKSEGAKPESKPSK